MKMWLGGLCLLIAGCTTTVPSALDAVRPGMDKDKVLESVGSPARTYREAMQDHWIYEYFMNDQQWRRDVVFVDSKVVKITRAISKNDWTKGLEQADSMEEFEQKAREHGKHANNFKSVDGQPDDPPAK